MIFENFLRSLPTFKLFTDRDLEALSKAMQLKEYGSGHTFTQQGTKGKELFLLVAGTVVVARFDAMSGATHKLKDLGPGEFFGLLSLVDETPAAATCTASGPVTAASLPRSAYNLLTRSAAPIAYHFQLLVARQLARDLHDRNQALRQLLSTL